MSTMTAAAERRRDLAWRVDSCRKALRPLVNGDDPEARTARRCWTLLSEVAADLTDGDEDGHG